PRTGSCPGRSRRTVASDLQSSLTGALRERGHPAVIQPSAPIEHGAIDPRLLGPRGDQLADRLRGGRLAAGPDLPVRSLSERRRPPVVDQLHVDVSVRPVYGEAGPLGAAHDLLANPRVPMRPRV